MEKSIETTIWGLGAGGGKQRRKLPFAVQVSWNEGIAEATVHSF